MPAPTARSSMAVVVEYASWFNRYLILTQRHEAGAPQLEASIAHESGVPPCAHVKSVIAVHDLMSKGSCNAVTPVAFTAPCYHPCVAHNASWLSCAQCRAQLPSPALPRRVAYHSPAQALVSMVSCVRRQATPAGASWAGHLHGEHFIACICTMQRRAMAAERRCSHGQQICPLCSSCIVLQLNTCRHGGSLSRGVCVRTADYR